MQKKFTLNYFKQILCGLNLFNIFNVNPICTFKYIVTEKSSTCSSSWRI